MRRIKKSSAYLYQLLLIPLCFFLVGCGVVVVAANVGAEPVVPMPVNGERLLTVHDGQQKGILTKASTVGEALAEAGILVDPNDLVEPGLDEQLVATHYDVNIYRARPVTVVDGGLRQRVMSPYQTAKQIAEHAGILLRKEDTATLEPHTDMVSQGAGVQLTITRATSFTLMLYGTKTVAFTQAATVGDMLSEKHITISDKDTVSVPVNTPIVEGMTVAVWRDGIQTVAEERPIDFPVEKVKDMDREVGYREVKTPGQPGKRTVTYEIEMLDGKEIGRKEISSIVTEEPKPQIEIVGGKLTNTFNGTFAEALARLRSCEGSYTTNTGNGYYGAYQFDIGTWGGYGGFTYASDAPASVQDEKAWLTYQRRGWNPWPSCSRSMGLQDIYR